MPRWQGYFYVNYLCWKAEKIIRPCHSIDHTIVICNVQFSRPILIKYTNILVLYVQAEFQNEYVCSRSSLWLTHK